MPKSGRIQGDPMIEREEQDYEAMNAALAFTLANLHTTVVCKVEEITGKTLSCKPVINRVVNGESKELPLFTDVPPVFMHGGSSYIAMPVAVGDYCLLMITERCYDAWYFGDDFVSPMELRMHDYSDGFALCGIKNDAGAVEIPDVITMIGEMYANGKWTHDGDLTRTGNETVAGNRTHNGSVTITDTMTAATSVLGAASFDTIKSGGQSGVSGVFTSADSKTITVTNGIITGIV